jgi:hypothetical protein
MKDDLSPFFEGISRAFLAHRRPFWVRMSVASLKRVVKQDLAVHRSTARNGSAPSPQGGGGSKLEFRRAAQSP